MTTAQDVINLAVSQLGVHEEGNNNVLYNTWFYGHPVSGQYPWCSVFVSWCFNQLNAKDLLHVFSSYSGDILNAGREAHEEVGIDQAGPGDVVIFDWGSGGITDHIGIVEKNLGGGTVQTIEGNTSDMVARRFRTVNPHCVMWFIRPKYNTTPAPKPVKEEEEMSL